VRILSELASESARPHRALLGLLFISVVTVVYWPGLSGDFIFDDLPNIVQKSSIHVKQLSTEQLARSTAAYDGGPFGRPLATLSFGLNHLACGLDARCFKKVNLALHLLNALLLFKLLSILPPSLLGKSRSEPTFWVAAGLALAWAVHPLQVSTVLYVVQRMEMLALSFTLAGLILYAQGRRQQLNSAQGGWKRITGGSLVAMLGLSSKETALLFPLYALCLEWAVFRFAAQDKKTRSLIRLGYILAFALAGLFFIAVVLPHYLGETAYTRRAFTLGERLLTQFRALPVYLGMIVLPNPDSMTFYYDHIQHSTGLFEPLTTMGGALLISVLLSAALLLRRALPLVSFGIVLFFAAHFLTSNIVPLELAFEHRNYFALLGVLLAVYSIAHAVMTQFTPASNLGAALGVVVILGLSSLTAIRASTWGEPFNLAMHHAAINKHSERAQTELGVMYGSFSNYSPDSLFFDSAILRLEKASRIDNASPLPEQALIILAVISQSEVDDDWWESLLDKLRKRPIGAQETWAVQKLLENRLQGFEISDDRLREVFETLSTRAHVNPILLANFGFYALSILDDELMAAQAFQEARRLGLASEDQISGWKKELVEGGYTRIAEILD